MAADGAPPSPPDHEAMPEGEEPPPPGAKIMAWVRWAILVAAAIMAAGAWWSLRRAPDQHEPAARSTHAPERYRCPMHPQIVSDHPGECPICHMTLIPVDEPGAGSPPAPVTPASASPPGSGAGVAPGSSPPNVAPVQLTFDRIQAIGVRTDVATERPMKHAVRATAIVEAPEQGAAEVHVRATGFVERIMVAQSGVLVTAGQPLLAIYSPEIYQAESELLSARQWSGGDAGARSMIAVRKKLELLGMGAADVDKVLATGEPIRAVPVYAPSGGYVMKKGVVLGARVTPEMTLYEIQDLSTVYVVAEVFQEDLALVRVGTEGRFTPTPAAGEPAVARVDLVYPSVSAEARTTRVRMQLRNGALRFRPGQYGTVELDAPARRVLVVPRDAIVDTGQYAYVFLDEGGGRFSPRVVRVGEAEGDQVSIDAGLSAGDRVVSGATFLVDSESRLQASITQVTDAEPGR